MRTEIYSVIYRMVHKYGWNWGLTRGHVVLIVHLSSPPRLLCAAASV